MKLQKREQAQHGLFPFSIYKPTRIPTADTVYNNRRMPADLGPEAI
jgi:hypothetical protein